MKSLISLITFYFILSGCGIKPPNQAHVAYTPVKITAEVPVAISDSVDVPGVVLTGTAVTIDPDNGRTTWDWPEATTEVTIREGNLVDVKTEVKPRRIFVTLRDTVTVTLRDTVERLVELPAAPIELPPMPAEGSNSMTWIWWGFAALASLLFAIFGIRKANKE